MKIILTMNLPYTRIFGGANKSNKNLAEEFGKRGHEVIVLAPALATPSHITHEELLAELSAEGHTVQKEDGYYTFTIDGVKIHAVINASKLRNKLIQKVKQENPDWVMISAEDPSQTLLNAAFEAAPDKVIYLAHTPQMFPFGAESMYPGEKRTQVIGKSRLIVTISDFVADYIRSNTGFEVMVNHPPHFGEGPYAKIADFDNKYILTMNPCGVKGIDIFVGLAEAFPDIPFAYVPGWGTTPSDVKRMAKVQNITPLKNEPNLSDLLQQAKLLLMPTLWSEGFGMATVDAMLRGIPVLASDYGGLKEAKLGTDFSIPINPIQGFTEELDENSLPQAILPKQDLTPWKTAIQELYFNKESYEKQVEVAYEKSHKFISNLSIDKLENWMHENIPGAVKSSTNKIDIKNLTPEQKKKLLLELKKKKEQKEAKFKINVVPTSEDYALSYAQKRLWILDQINDGYYGYIIPSSMLLQGDLNKQALLDAFKHVIDKHQSLRTYFVSINGEPRQKILTDYQFTLEEHDFSFAEDPHDTTRIFAQVFNKKLFDLSKAPLLRVALIKIAPDEHVLLFAMHHIISDGWSMKILTGEVYTAYLHLVKEGFLQNAELEIHYKDFSAWQNNLIEFDENSALKTYWYRKLGGEITVLNLPTDKPRPKVKTYNGKIIEQTIDEKVVAQIHTFCTQHKISLFAYLTSAVKILLHRYTDQKNIIVGTPTAGRNNSQLENQIGFYVNMLALRDELKPTDNVETILTRVHQTIVEALDHEAYPYDKIVEDLDQARDLSRSPLFDVMVSIEDVTSQNENSISDTNNVLKSSGFNTEENEIGSSHDLAFIFYRNENELSVNLVYNVDLFEEWKGKQILQHISRLTESLIESPQKTLTELNYLSPKEEQFLLETPVSVDWPKDWLIHQRFEAIAEQFPQRIALSYEGKKVTYETLNHKANQLAHYLRKQGVGKNTIVGLLVQRSNDIMTVILAVLKAGGAYLPIDPSYPKDRIDYTLSNSQAQLVLSDGSYSLDERYAGELINLTDINYEEFSTENLSVINSPDDLAYIIYTSGSTGWPKGVMISHYNVIRLLFNDEFQFNFDEQDVWTLFHSYCFDFSVWEMYGALLYGGKLVIVPKLTAQSPREFWQLLQNENVTVLNQTPGAFYNLIEEAKVDTVVESSVRYVIFGGEALNPKKLAFWQKHYPDTQLINMYGITETTVHVTFKEITSEEIKSGVSNIGKAIPTLETLVLDKQQRLLPVGVAGELCVGGLGLAKGYLNNSELTDTKFIPHPFREGEKLYRSGDLAKILPNGEMEYLGRIDFQVKIRGFRIELGEIENKLNILTTIEDCLVIVKQDESDDNFLIAYYVSESPIEIADLREHLGKQLPDYMIPSFFVHYKNFPLNQNGKVDRKVLINPLEDGGVARRKAVISPETPTEKKLMELWNEVLKKEESSIDDNFFEVGGHSLKANQLIGKIYRAFGVEIRLGYFFDAPTVRELSELIDTKKGTTNVDEITPLPEQLHYEMSYAQKRMWILEQMDSSHNAYTMPMAFDVKGELCISKLEKSFQAIIARHESLRTTFDIVNNEPRQFVHSSIEAPINVVKSTSLEVDKQLAKTAKRIFDLKKGPLITLDIFQLDEKHHYLILNMHHIISDGHSMVVLFQELFANYSNQEQTDTLRIQYKDFAAWQNKQLQNDADTKRYWLDKLDGELILPELPIDFKRPEERSFNGANLSCDFSKDKFDFLNELAKKHNTSMFVIVLSLLKIYIHKITRQSDIIIGSPVSGRIHPSLENQIGFYVNTLPLRSQVNGKDTIDDVIDKVKQTVQESLHFQSYPFDLMVDELKIDRNLGRNPLFEIMISMDEQQNQIEAEHQIQELTISTLLPEHSVAKFDLTFGFHHKPHEEYLGMSLNYNTDIFLQSSIENIKDEFDNLITAIQLQSNKELKSFSLLSKKKANDYIDSLKHKGGNYPKNKSIIDCFEQIVIKNSSKNAIKFNDEIITYDSLDKQSNVLAHRLLDLEIKSGDVVGIVLDRSIIQYISILAILKVGATYLPIDPKTPLDRSHFMLVDGGAKCVISSQKYVGKYETISPILIVDEGVLSGDESRVNVKVTSDSIAYIVYTSGSTGTPKGVMIPHKGVLRLVLRSNFIDISSEDNIVQLSNYSFDGSVFDIFGAFLNGATLTVIDQETAINPNQFAEFLIREEISILFLTTALFNIIVQTKVDAFSGLKKILFGGEKVSVAHVEKALAVLGQDKLIHVYGPTETTVFASFYPINKVEPNADTIPIGVPVSSTGLLVLDEGMNICPAGKPGELFISGDGVASGYLNNEELTNERFVINPFDFSEKLYKTGDLVYMNTNNEIVFIDRIDNQVKIRGFRIELGEIESKLIKIDDIQRVAITVVEDDNKHKALCAYYTSLSKISSDIVRKELGKTLPDYMIPSFFILVDDIPLNKNGKIDKAKLPHPYSSSTNYLKDVELPNSDTEKRLFEHWVYLLGVQKFGINENFFELGGQSLKAALLVNYIHQEFDSSFTISDVFKFPTIKQMADKIDSSEKVTWNSIQKTTISSSYPLSSAQRRLFIVSQFEGIGTTYNMPGALRIKGTLNIEQLERALNLLCQRHASLRTRFKLVDGEPVQELIDLTLTLKTEKVLANEVTKVLNDFVQPFDLSEAPLLRIKLLTISAQESVLLYDVHHIVSDGSSMEIIIHDLFALYHEVELPQLPIDYVDYAVWQQSTKLEEQENFWLEEFEAGIPSVNFPLDYPRKGVQEFEGGHVGFEFDIELSVKLKKFSEQNGSTMYMTLFALFGLTIAKLSNTNEIVLGTPVAGRSHKDLENLVGMFVNNLALRFQTNADQLLSDYFEISKQKIIDALDHQDYQIEDLVSALNVPREMGRNPIFDILFTFNAKTDEKIKATQQDLKVEQIGANITTTKFDLTLGASESENGLHFTFEFAKHLFKTESIERFAKVFELVTQQVLNGAEKIADIDILTIEDKKAIKQFNATRHEPWPSNNLISGFQKQVDLSPNALAVADEQKEYTYLDLDQKSDEIASFLLKQGVQKSDVIALVLPRSADTITVMLGVMKTGACYLPIDISHPLERIKFYISDSEAKFSITTAKQLSEIANALSVEEILQYTQSEKFPCLTAEDKAYMIYTSGSTGTPKGVKIHHGSIVNTIYSQIELFNLTPEDTYLQFASLSFDASITDIYGALLSGAQLVIPSEEIKKDPDLLVEFCNTRNVTIALLPPALLAVIEEQSFTTLRKLISGGEALKLSDAQRLSKRFELFNAYGPTEVGVACTIYPVKSNIDKNVPIGYPIKNMEIFILNEQLQNLPIGTAGEICIAGIGVAEGYHKRPELNEEKFISSPFSEYPRLYRTGDLGRINSNLELEYLGRIDQQVKIRGYRIELGEIEHQLRQIPDIKNAVVTVFGKENKKLVAYWVSDKLLETHVIKNMLSKKLPDYMIPDVFIVLDELPMTIGGKINFKALPEPIYLSNEAIIPSQTESQQKIWECWSDVLGIENFGITNNFFELGGNSILAMKVVAKLSMDFEIKVNNLFEHPTIEGLANVVKYKPENVKNKLIQLKQLFHQQQNGNKIEREKINFLRNELSTYQASFLPPKRLENESKNILVTGALGFLGMYLVHELLTETKAHLILLVRPKLGLTGEERFQEKVEFYFNDERNLFSRERITVVEGDITQEELSDSSNFDKNRIDCIIHTASNTSHFGNWEEFEKVNVKGTEHVLKFAEKYGASVHHISTLSVAGGVSDADIRFFSENHTPEQIKNSNYYTQSKIEAEKVALSYNEKVPVSIYRVGNLMPAYKTGMFQENSADNAFMNTLKFYFELGKIPAFTPKIYDFSFIDEVAKSIRLLLNVAPNIYHLSNPNKISDIELGHLIAHHWKDYEVVEILDLIDEYLENIETHVYVEKLQAYISNSKVLEMEGGLTKFYVSSAKTNYALNQLGFEWKKLTPEYMTKVLQHLEKTGFIQGKKQKVVIK